MSMAAIEGARAKPRPCPVHPDVAYLLSRAAAVASRSAMIRPATLLDMPELMDIETTCFTGDRISRPSFRRFLTGRSAATLVDTARGRLRGYALVLFRRSSSIARLYSFAVTPTDRRHGVGKRLLAAAVATARARRTRALRLEIRPDNLSARLLYENAGFTAIGTAPRFYEDGADAIRMEIPLISRKGPQTP